MRMPPPPLDTSHHPAAVAAAAAAAAAPPVGHGIYEPASWRPYPPSFDPHPPDQHRVSTAASNPSQATPIPPTHGYPVIPNRELPQLPPDGPYGRPNSLPGPATTPPEAHHHHHHHHPPPPAHPAHSSHPSSGNYRLNGSGAGGGPPPPPSLQDAPPHSAPPEYRSRMAFPPEQPANGDTAGAGGLPAHSIPPAQYSTPAVPQTPTPFDPPGYYNSSAYGLRQRKAARAQQVRHPNPSSTHLILNMYI